MTRQFDVKQEDRTIKRNVAVIQALEFDLVGSLRSGGAELLGFSARIEEWECLLTLRAVLDERRVVAFVASDTLANAIVKVVRDAKRDKVHWKDDKYRANGG